MRLLYRLNDRDLRMLPDSAYDLIIAIADGTVTDVRAIADRLSPWVVDLHE